MTTDSAKSPDSLNFQTARFFALIPCAGQGSRAAASHRADASAPGANASPPLSKPARPLCKQYQEIAGQSMVGHTLAAFSKVARLSRTLVVVAANDLFFDQHAPSFFDVSACGGASRAESVLNGLEALLRFGAGEHDWVLVHDAARCLITAAQINQLIDACAQDEVGGLLAHKVPDTLKTGADGRVGATLDRTDKWLAQTPQMFRIGPLMKALRLAGSAATDESSAMEAIGLWPKLVIGSAENFKVTYPEDVRLAEAILLGRVNSSRLQE